MRFRFRVLGPLLTAFVVARTFAAAQPAPDPSEWTQEFREILQHNILGFWIDHAIDRQHGGMIGWLDREGKPIPPGTKSLVQQARVVWTFSASYRMYPEPVYREVAGHTLGFLRQKMWDPKHGGYYWLVSREGRVRDTRKHLYGQSFAIYALAEYAQAFGDARAREEALALFQLMDRQAHDGINGGYREAFGRSWKILRDDLTLGSRGRKSMNTHIHLLESFTALYLATTDTHVRQRLEELLELCVEKIVDTEGGYARLFFTDDWKPADSQQSSYGHDIELSWLMLEAAQALGRPHDPRVVSAALRLVEHTLRDGFEHACGGIYDDGPAQGPAASKRMIWWVQAEAIVGLLNAYQLTGEKKYWEAFEKQARYTLDTFVDREHGEWHHAIEPDGRVTGYKAGEWKAPYHAGRACLEVVRRLGNKR